MELLLLKVPSKLGVWTLEESLTMIKKIPKLWSWDLDAFKKEEKLIEEVVTNFEISDLFISSQSPLAAAAAAAPSPAAGAVVFNHKAQFRMCWQTRSLGTSCPNPARSLQRKTQLLHCANAHLSHFIHPRVKAWDRDVAWLKCVKPRCAGIAAGAQVGLKEGRQRGKMISSSLRDKIPALMTLKSDQWSQETCVRGETTSSKVGNSSPTLPGPQYETQSFSYFLEVRKSGFTQPETEDMWKPIFILISYKHLEVWGDPATVSGVKDVYSKLLMR